VTSLSEDFLPAPFISHEPNLISVALLSFMTNKNYDVELFMTTSIPQKKHNIKSR
jgi:hypothetical protein